MGFARVAADAGSTRMRIEMGGNSFGEIVLERGVGAFTFALNGRAHKPTLPQGEGGVRGLN